MVYGFDGCVESRLTHHITTKQPHRRSETSNSTIDRTVYNDREGYSSIDDLFVSKDAYLVIEETYWR